MARESKPAVIFIDEIDALCSARGEGGESEASRRIKTEFLTQMDGVDSDNRGILVLGATNIPWGLDLAMRRRFQRIVHIGLPETSSRSTLFQLAIGDTPHTLTMQDYSHLAAQSDGFSGSDITNVVHLALMIPVRITRTATHFKKAIDEEGQLKYAACSPGDPEAIPMGMQDVPKDELATPPVELRHVQKALRDSHPTSTPDSLAKYIEWTKTSGMEG